MNERMKRTTAILLAVLLAVMLLPVGSLAAGEITVELKTDVTEAKIGDSITWTASASGGDGSYRYCFYIFLDDKVVERGEYGTANSYRYTVAASGSYTARVYVKDGSGAVQEYTGGAVTVPAQEVFALVTADKTEAELGDTVTWTASAIGGTGKIRYCFYLFVNGEAAERGEYDTVNTYSCTVSEAGTYSVRVYVKDGTGEVQEFGGDEVFVAPEPIRLELTADKTSIKVGDSVTWTAASTGGFGKIRYCFYVFVNGEMAERGEYDTANTYSYTASEAGTLSVRVYVKDGTGEAQEFNGGEVNVEADPITALITADKTQAKVKDTVTWTVSAAGGVGKLRYCFYVMKDGQAVEKSEYVTENSFKYAVASAGNYSVRVYVKDGTGEALEFSGGEVSVGASKPVVLYVVAAVVLLVAIVLAVLIKKKNSGR